MKSSNKPKREGNGATLRWIFKCTKKYLPAVALISLFSIIVSLSSVELALLSKKVLEIATGDAEGELMSCALGLVGIVILQILLSGADTVLKAYAGGKLTISVRNYLFGVLNRKKYSKLYFYHSGDLLNRFTSDADVVINSIISVIPGVASMTAQLVGGITAILLLDSKLAFIVLFAGIAVPAFGRLISRKYKRLHKEVQQTEGKARSFMQECFENVIVLKAFGSVKPFAKKLNQYMKRNFSIKIKRSYMSSVMHLSLYSFFTVGYYAILIWGAGEISQKKITYGMLMAFLQLVSQLRMPLQNISGIFPQYYSAIASAERLMEIENGEEDKPLLDDAELNDVIKSFGGIEFKNVSFAYDGEEILKNCSFTVPKGKITALTGESGSGKSTVFKIILGLYDAKSGDITVNGGRKLDPSLRGLFAYVPQGNMVLSGTIRENITLCNDNVNEKRLIEAAKAAEIYDFISSMPAGFETVLAERGAGLSEGQIQRISIARALLTDAPVLLLDEATSALDEATETRLLNNIRALKDKTVLFVTHRNTSLGACDRIIHIENKQFSVVKE